MSAGEGATTRAVEIRNDGSKMRIGDLHYERILGKEAFKASSQDRIQGGSSPGVGQTRFAFRARRDRGCLGAFDSAAVDLLVPSSSSGIQRSAQAPISFNASCSSRPFGVRSYSTRTGLSGTTIRTPGLRPRGTKPLRQHPIGEVGNRGLDGGVPGSSPEAGVWRMAPVHRLPMSSTALMKAGANL